MGIEVGQLAKHPRVFGQSLPVGWESGNKFELSPRGMKFGISLHIPDNWGRQLAAGGEGGIRTRVRLLAN